MEITKDELYRFHLDSKKSIEEHRVRKAARLKREYETRHNLPVKAISILAATGLTVINTVAYA